LGAAVAQLPGGEIVPAMERGVIDAFEFNNPTSDRRFGAQDVAKIYMLGSYHQAMEFFEIMFNKTKYDALPAEHQAILKYAAEAASTNNFSKAMDYYSKDLQALVNEHGVKVIRTPESVFDAQLAAWDKLTAELSKDAFFGKVVESGRMNTGHESLIALLDALGERYRSRAWRGPRVRLPPHLLDQTVEFLRARGLGPKALADLLAISAASAARPNNPMPI